MIKSHHFKAFNTIDLASAFTACIEAVGTETLEWKHVF